MNLSPDTTVRWARSGVTMRIDQYFDVIYDLLGIALLCGLAIALVRGVVISRRHAVPADARHGRGVALIAFGTALAFGGGLFADAQLKDSRWFQQVRFGIYFLGFAFVVAGLVAVLRASLGPDGRGARRWSLLLWILYLASLVVAGILLVAPATFVLNQYGDQVQRPLYWAPLLIATASGAVALGLARRGRSTDDAHRPQSGSSQLRV
ncbi:hypothetical protein FOE78_21505 [Microlunatus elymi]|uniref:Uncharacterized protein n=1 Tax=Microlunatus elymi TaxID=2596828 RepID=A0A516Q433_9ACTN|nr:hypothetical protein [Microlunatus elymi]QDP98132.1 hypothetical protein FOE78_21505 [Microlunatus elymi]